MSVINIKKIIISLLFLSIFSGCSTIAGKNKLYFYSNSQDTIVDVNGKECTSPCNMKVGKERTLEINVRSGNNTFDKYFKGEQLFYPNLGTTTNIIVYLIPMTIDLISGAWYDYPVNQIYFYVTDDKIYFFDLDRSVFAYAMKSYADLKAEETTGGNTVKKLSDLSGVSVASLQSMLISSKKDDIFARNIAFEHVSKVISKDYEKLKKNAVLSSEKLRNLADKMTPSKNNEDDGKKSVDESLAKDDKNLKEAKSAIDPDIYYIGNELLISYEKTLEFILSSTDAADLLTHLHSSQPDR